MGYLIIIKEIFLVLFSILYGVMLQSLAKTQSFPLGRVLRGFVGRNKHNDDVLLRKEFWECQRLFMEEKQIALGEFNEDQITEYKNWLLDMWRWRAFSSFILLNVLPFLYFLGIFFLLGGHYWESITFKGDIWQLFLQALSSGIIFWAALGVFGFYRFHHALIARTWKRLYCDVAKEIEERGTSFDYRVNIFCGCLYCLPPLVSLILIAGL
jgi:hypothetical protein